MALLFEFQLDAQARYLAAFTAPDPTDKAAYLHKYTMLLSDPTVNNQTILVGDVVAGSVAKFEIDGKAEISYWLDRAFWHRGIATRALSLFLKLETTLRYSYG
ncbi:GNAT family N-acetyltransferase [Hymenobacter sp. B81]|uniref:GNAT family N-acetyltransferase n=1 Tax=Hymenobacter sp. B81 TaxID=3344878 RepID=UPI0037DDD487